MKKFKLLNKLPNFRFYYLIRTDDIINSFCKRDVRYSITLISDNNTGYDQRTLRQRIKEMIETHMENLLIKESNEKV